MGLVQTLGPSPISFRCGFGKLTLQAQWKSGVIFMIFFPFWSAVVVCIRMKSLIMDQGSAGNIYVFLLFKNMDTKTQDCWLSSKVRWMWEWNPLFDSHKQHLCKWVTLTSLALDLEVRRLVPDKTSWGAERELSSLHEGWRGPKTKMSFYIFDILC